MKTAARIKAEKLRQQGFGIKEIARKVGVSPSTASRWCSATPLTQPQQERLERKRRVAGLKALAPWVRKNRKLKQDDLRDQKVLGVRDLGKLARRDLFLLGLGLYWGEGYKRGSQECGFTNSDPVMIRIILAWFAECYGIPTERIIARLTINERYREQTERITKTWSRETAIPISQFGKPTYIRGYDKSRLPDSTYRGTLRIKVRKGTSLRRRILASIAAINTQSIPNSRKTDS